MSNSLRRASIWAFAALFALLATNCSKPVPGEKEMLGKIKGKASLRLADGSTISRDDSDEYNPYLIKMDDGFLVLVFGSNRSCAASCNGHNIFVTRSTTAFDGINLPFFASPVVLQVSSSPAIDGTNKVTFGATKEGTGVRIFANVPGQSGFVKMVDVTNFTTPNPANWGNIANSNLQDQRIIGISADGNDVIALDATTGTAYLFSPTTDTTGNAAGTSLDGADSATQVKQDLTGFEDSIIAMQDGVTFAFGGGGFLGSISALDISLESSGLTATSINTFYADSSANDTLLFSASDGLSEDLYMITSHTAEELWNIAGIFGSDFSQNFPPSPDHWLNFEAIPAPGSEYDERGLDFINPLSCSGVNTPTFGTHNFPTDPLFGDYLQLNGTNQYVTCDGGSGADIGDQFTLMLWAKTTTTGVQQVLLGNQAGTATGFRLTIQSDNSVALLTSNGSTVNAQTSAAAITSSTWHHIAVVVDRLNSTADIYIDGIPSATGPTQTTFSTSIGSPDTLRIGATTTPDTFFTGAIDEVQIFRTALTESQIYELAYY